MKSSPVMESTGFVDWGACGESVALMPQLAAPGESSEFERVVHKPVTAIIGDLRRLAEARELGQQTDVVTLLVVESTASELQTRAAHEGLVEALRGVVGSLTLELAATGLRLNLVRTPTREAAEDTLTFLSSDAAGFVAGSTLDLRQGAV